MRLRAVKSPNQIWRQTRFSSLLFNSKIWLNSNNSTRACPNSHKWCSLRMPHSMCLSKHRRAWFRCQLSPSSNSHSSNSRWVKQATCNPSSLILCILSSSCLGSHHRCNSSAVNRLKFQRNRLLVIYKITPLVRSPRMNWGINRCRRRN